MTRILRSVDVTQVNGRLVQRIVVEERVAAPTCLPDEHEFISPLEGEPVRFTCRRCGQTYTALEIRRLLGMRDQDG